MNNSLVSCIIPSFKRTDTLKRAIDSILAQTHKEIEVLVVDDNIPGDEYSNALKDILKEYDERVILVTQKKHINGAVARNEGVKASHGSFIAFLDDDDEWLPTKIERQLSIMKSYPNISGVAGGASLWRGDKEISTFIPRRVNINTLLLDVLTRKIGLATSTFICKKEAFIEMGGFDPNLKRSQDIQLFADFLSKFQIYPMFEERTTRMYVESSINRLNSQKLAINKEELFHSIQSVLDQFSKATQKRIKSAHYYEVAYVAFKEKQYLFCIKYLIKGFCSPKSIVDLISRIKTRL